MVGTIASTQVSCPHRMLVIPARSAEGGAKRSSARNAVVSRLLFAVGPSRTHPYLSEFEQFEAHRLDLSHDPEDRRPIFDRTGEHSLAALGLTHHRRECGQSGRPEPALYQDLVDAWRRGHTDIVPPGPVSWHRRNPVIARTTAPCSSSRVQERPVERSRSSRARLTAEERSRAPSLE
jgi:hypothetical protein